MSHSRKRPARSTPAALKMETLEDRTVPAGNVDVVVNDGVLYARGDDQANQVLIGTAGDALFLRSLDGTTTFNNKAFLIVSGANRGADIRLHGGDDVLGIAGASFHSGINLEGGEGNDTIVLNGITVKRHTVIQTAGGEDAILVLNSDLRRTFFVDAGAGDDEVSVGDTRFGRKATFVGGDGFDLLGTSNLRFRGDPVSKGFEASFGKLIPVLAGDPPVVPPVTPPPPPANDTVAPTVALATTATNPTKLASIPVTATFSETVTGFDASDLTVTNGTVANFVAVNGSTYTFSVAPTADGEVSVAVRNSAAADAGGNTSTASNTLAVTVDRAGPTPTVTSTASGATTLNPIPFTVRFDEDVADFTLADVVVTNGTGADFAAVDRRTFTLNVSPTATGSVTVSVPAAAATDAAGNLSNAATPLTVNFAGSIVTTTISSTAPNPTSLASIPMSVTFSGDVTGFDASDLSVNNGTASTFVAVNARTYTFNVAPTNDGIVAVSVATGAARDAQNSPTQSANFTIVSDRSPPAVAILPPAAQETKASPIPVTVTFTEAVVGFDQSDVAVTNGTVSNFVAASGTTYTFNVTPTANGPVTLAVAAGAATDAAGNPNTASATVTRTFDTVAPAVAVTQQTTSDQTPTLTGTVSEPAATVVVTVNGSNFPATVTGTTWSANVTSTLAEGTYAVTATATDPAGNVGTVTLAGGLVVDTTPPVLTLSTTANSPTSLGTVPFKAEFTENVTGFDATDVTVSGGTVSNFVAVDGNSYTFDVVSPPEGDLSVSVAASKAADVANNGNVASSVASVTIDRTGPVVTVTASPPTPGTNPIPYTVTFSEDVTGFAAADLGVTNGSVVNFTAVDAKTYTFGVVPDGPGVVSVTAPANAATDAAGNPSTADTETVNFTGTTVSVTLVTAATSPTKNAPFAFTAAFSDDVTGFAAGDITVTNGTVQAFTAVDASNYTFEVVPTGQGVVTVRIPAGVAADAGPTPNSASNTVSITYDTVAPTAAANPLTTADPTPPLTGTVDDSTATVEVLVNGQTYTATVSGTTWTADVTDPLPDGTYDVAVTATDAAGNTTTSTLTGGLVVDATP